MKQCIGLLAKYHRTYRFELLGNDAGKRCSFICMEARENVAKKEYLDSKKGSKTEYLSILALFGFILDCVLACSLFASIAGE
ncbi:MAG TPA: hypothetical protein DCP56_03870 [Spirochaetaceae bacterium]|nr:hypothetical protein [Spirochaetaceae bacterium]